MAQRGPELPPLALRAGLNATASLVQALGRHRYRLSDAISNAIFVLDPVVRRTVIRNFRAAFPALTARQARRLAGRSFREYGRTSIDFLYVHHLDRARIVPQLHLVGGEAEVLSRYRSGQPGILLVIHHGSWDVPSTLAAVHGVELTAVMADEGNPALTGLVIWARAELGVRAVPASHSLRTLMRQLRAGKWLALLIDMPGDTPAVELPFLGHRARFSSAAAVLAARTGAPLVPAVCVRRPAGGYLVELHPAIEVEPGDEPGPVMARALPVFEAAVRRWPEQWYPFSPDRFSDLGPG